MQPFIQKPELKQFRVHRDLAFLVMTVFLCALPFLRQPFHMDDNFYMDMARNAQTSPMYPNDTPYAFQGQSAPDVASHSHPPLQTYFLALIQSSFGEGPGKEWIYHLFAMAYPILAVVAFYFLCARLLERPLWPALVLACSPLFMVMQHTLMTDIPTLAFWLAAIASFLWAADSKRRSFYAASAVFQFAAMFTSYQSFALTPLLAFYQIRRRGGAFGWISLILAPAAMAAWFAVNYAHYHRMLLGGTLGYVQSRHFGAPGVLATKLIAVLEYQGWLILFPFFFLYLYARGIKGRLLALAALAATYLAQLRIPEYRLMERLIFIIGLTVGFFIVLRMAAYFSASLGRKDSPLGFTPIEGQFVGLWYYGVMAYCVAILTEGSARYILNLVPPVLICFFRQLEVMEASEYRRRPNPMLGSAMLASGSLVLSLFWGLALSHADQEFARIYPRIANEFCRIAGGMKSFFGGEWGFRYYLSRAGVRQLPIDESLVNGGSFIVLPRLALPYPIPADLQSMTMPLHTFSYDVGTPLRILDREAHAGFYSTGWGLIPFSFSRRALEDLEIRQVNFMVERLPWAKIECNSSIKPWPGYLSIQSEAPLAILANPGTSISYSWSEREPLNLELKFGVESDEPGAGSKKDFTFEVSQRDASGKIVAQVRRILNPGLRKEDRQWQPEHILLQGTPEGEGILEFRYECDKRGASGVGAFAEAFLKRPQP
jgi:4-amino-4-deoxy-L-arabinose transferase-like glycosyltransferase